jgi:hypothetical protein
MHIVCTSDSVCDSLVPTGQNGTCYRGGLAVFENHQMCNVTSKVKRVSLISLLTIYTIRSKDSRSVKGPSTSSYFFLQQKGFYL